MEHSVLQFLERSAERFPDRVALEDKDEKMTYRELWDFARRIGSAVASASGAVRRPVAVFMDKSIRSVVMFQGVLCSGNFYCPLDSKMPEARILSIMDVARPALVLTDEKHRAAAEAFAGETEILVWEEVTAAKIDQNLISRRTAAVIQDDPLYMLFTSGSTGVPKGVVVSHRVVINYLGWLGNTFHMDETTVFGNQAPLYFDISVHDIYGAMFFGGKMVIIPPSLFGFPVRLIEFMNERGVNSILWVPSAMSIIAALGAFKEIKPAYLREVMFAGEVLPRKYLDYWMENLPDAVFANLYGPTETFVCTGYICTGKETDGEPMPVGRPIANVRALVLDESGRQVQRGEQGELCICGSCLASGYYNNPEKTTAAFAVNPVNAAYPERLYHTGDLVYEDENGDLIYVSRKDYQIKHMGYRIELGEIETAAYGIADIRDCVCVYDDRRKRIVLFYDGKEIEKTSLKEQIGTRVPAYMIPGKFVYMTALPHNANGKIDRRRLMEEL